ncbi:MAG: TraB/GumN family protein [Pseudomonadota bacterium]
MVPIQKTVLSRTLLFSLVVEMPFLTFISLTLFLLSISSLPSHAQEIPDDMDVIVVRSRLPGPPLWRVSNGDNEVLIFGVVEPLPKSFEWDTRRLERALTRADAYLSAPEVGLTSINPIKIVRMLRQLNKVKRNADGKTLEEILPNDVYQKFSSARLQYFGDREKLERLTPLFAADAIFKKVMDQADLTDSQKIYKTADKLARRADVEIRSVKVTERVKRKALFNDLRNLSIDDQITCLSAVIDLVTDHVGSLKVRAEIWAEGDVSPLVTPAHPPLAPTCVEMFTVNEQLNRILSTVKVQWLEAVEQSLRDNQTTVATLRLADVIESKGLIAELARRGYSIEGPMREDATPSPG